MSAIAPDVDVAAPAALRLERTMYSFMIGKTSADQRYIHVLHSEVDASSAPGLCLFTAYITNKASTRSVSRMRPLKITNFVLNWHDDSAADTANDKRHGMALFEFGEVDKGDTKTPRMIHFNVEMRRKMFIHAVKAPAGKWSLESPNVLSRDEPKIMPMFTLSSVELVM